MPTRKAAAPPESAPVEVGGAPFAPLTTPTPRAGSGPSLQQLLDIPVTLSVELARVALPLERVTQLAPGAVIDLEREASLPVDVLVNGTPVARAEVVTVGEKYGIRVVSLVSPEERLKHAAGNGPGR
jgi:flagellar motor switch protein FliN/FliY